MVWNCSGTLSSVAVWIVLLGTAGSAYLWNISQSQARPRELEAASSPTTRPDTTNNPAESAPAGPAMPSAVARPPRAIYEFIGPSGKPSANDRTNAVREELKGKALAAKGDCGAGLEHFKKAYGLAAREGALVAAAECYESQGQFVEAYEQVALLTRVHVVYEQKRKKRRGEWLERLKSKTAVIDVRTNVPGVTILIDGGPWVVEGEQDDLLPAMRVAVGEHQIRAAKQGFEPFEVALVLEPGEERLLNVSLTALAPPPKPVDLSGMATAPVTDFCRIKLGTDKTRYQKQRLVTFDLAGEKITNEPEQEIDAKGNVVGQHRAFEQARLHDHLRAAFFRTFPVPRFFNVKSTAESPEALQRKLFISSEEMIKASEVDTFAAYSIACADWVAMPRVTSKDAKWQQVEKERVNPQGKKEKYRAWSLSVTWTSEMDVYRREGEGWRLHATIDGSNGGLLGLAFGLAASAQQGNGKKQLRNLSDRPDSNCAVPFVGTLSEISTGLSACYNSTAELEGAVAQAGTLSGSASVTVSGSADALQVGGAPATSSEDAGTPDASADPIETARSGAIATAKSEPMAASAEVLAPAQVVLRDYRGSFTPSSLATLRAAGKVTGLEATARAANHAYTACNGAVNSIAKAEKQLRDLANTDLSKLGASAALGFSACIGIGVSVDLGAATAPGTGELRSNLCQGVKDDVALGPEAMTSVAVCQGRVAMEQATLVLQKEAKRLDGWKLFAPLQFASGAKPGVFGLSLGRDEGADRGDLYVAVELAKDGSQRNAGWGRIVRQGPGGEPGDKDPSHFKFRTLPSPVGSRMDEHAQVGVVLGMRPEMGFFTSKGSLSSGVVFGAALEGGYNASSLVPLADEIWSRIYLSYEAGQQSEKFLSVDLVPEAVYYVGNRLAMFTGGGMGYASAKRNSAFMRADGTTTNSNISGSNAGIVVMGGADYSLSPDWYARASLWYRQGVSTASLKAGDQTLSENAGTLSALRLGVQAGYIF